MSDDAPPPVPRWPSSVPPRPQRGPLQWVLTVAGALLLIATMVFGSVVMLFAGCVYLVSGDKSAGQAVALVIACFFGGGFLLWLGRARAL
jgi:hypothetical protein